jgi:hypothetical protein
VNKSLLLTASGLLAAIACGVLYGRWTQAAPEAHPAEESVARAAPAPSIAGGQLPTPTPSAAAISSTAISPEAQRLEERRQLYESVDALVQASEFEKARSLLDADQARYGDDLAPPWHDLEQSYRLIADCLEHPDPKLRLRAQAFAQVSEAVSLRPRILKACGATH